MGRSFLIAVFPASIFLWSRSLAVMSVSSPMCCAPTAWRRMRARQGS